MSGCAPNREHWSSRAGFILAAVGSAVGLGEYMAFYMSPIKMAAAAL